MNEHQRGIENCVNYNLIAREFSASRAYIWPDLFIFKQFVRDGDKILDLGCGNGRLIGLFKEIEVDYLGIDVSEEIIKIARKNFPERKFMVMDASNLDLPAKSFDAVFAIAVLNHFPRNRQAAVLKNISRVLKPNGYLFITNWNLWNVFRRKSFWRGGFKKNIMTTWKSGRKNAQLYYYAFTKRELRRLLEQNGLAVQRNYYSKGEKKSNWLFGNNIITIARKNI